MQSITTRSGKQLSKIGIGSYGVGGLGHRTMTITNKQEDSKYIEALRYTLERGVNFTEISLGYGHGQSIKLFKQALDASSIGREDIFLTHSLYPTDSADMSVAIADVKDFYKIMETDYADSTLVTQDFIMKFGREVTYELLASLLKDNKTRYVSLSNASPAWIRDFKAKFGDKFFAHEGHLSFEVREVAEKAVFDVCSELNVKNIIWRPLRQNRTVQHNWDLLVELSGKYKKTQSQIILNWICHLGYSPMVMSSSSKHIDENIASTEFEMTEDDYKRMSDFRPPNYHPPQVRWEDEEGGMDVVLLANEFEKNIS